MNTSIVSRVAVLVCLFAVNLKGADPAPGALRWWKGNLHTHTLWSDGDDYPEMVTDWYKRHGYHFLGLSDHNVMQEGQKWFELTGNTVVAGQVVNRGGGEVLEKYLKRFGPDWVEQRVSGGKHQIRLKPLQEFRTLFEEPGRFLMISSQEITATWTLPASEGKPERTGPVHINATNLRDPIKPYSGRTALEVMQRNVDALLEQRERTGQPMFPHLNHPNFRWAITAEELTDVKGERFFEVYNGHQSVHNEGDETRLSTDQMWDVILTKRLAEKGMEPIFGLGVDDSHNYHQMTPLKSNPGRGWVMVRAARLTPEAIVQAMEAGDFYATSGVVLSEVKRGSGRLEIEIVPEPGVTYVTKFIGTRRGYDASSQEIPAASPETKTMNHRRYSADVGAVLAEVAGVRASYTFKGDEIYVRAKVISSKPCTNAVVAGEVETAWVQPLVGANPGSGPK